MRLGRNVCRDRVGCTGWVRYEKQAPRHPGRLSSSRLLESMPLSVLDTGLPQVL